VSTRTISAPTRTDGAGPGAGAGAEGAVTGAGVRQVVRCGCTCRPTRTLHRSQLRSPPPQPEARCSAASSPHGKGAIKALGDKFDKLTAPFSVEYETKGGVTQKITKVHGFTVKTSW